MKILILVEARVGEESMWVSDINEEEMNKLEPLLPLPSSPRSDLPSTR